MEKVTEWRQLERIARDGGWVVERRRKHWSARSPDGRQRVTWSATASDGRALKNAVAYLRRAMRNHCTSSS